MKVSITLPSIYPEALHRALSNIAATTKNEYEVLVVSPFRVERPNVVWIEETGRRGCVAAHSAAFEHATGDFITATADDFLYEPGWDAYLLARHSERSRNNQPLCLGLHYGPIGTTFGIYYANFPFMAMNVARQIDWYDGKFIRGFADSDLSFKVWSIGGRCEFTAAQLINKTKDDSRKGDDLCRAEDLEFFVRKWAWRYGQGFDTSHLRSINLDIDPEEHPEFVKDFSVYLNSPFQVAQIARSCPPYLIRSENKTNIVRFKGQFYRIPHDLGPIDLEDEIDNPRILRYSILPEPISNPSLAKWLLTKLRIG